MRRFSSHSLSRSPWRSPRSQAAPAGSVGIPAEDRLQEGDGQKLVVDTARSFPGHYTAFNLGVQTGTRQARYGTFTIYLVTDPTSRHRSTRC